MIGPFVVMRGNRMASTPAASSCHLEDQPGCRAGFLQSQTRQEASTRKEVTPTYGSRVVKASGGTIVPTALFSCHPARSSQTHVGTCLTQPSEISFDVRLSSLSTLPTKHLHREQTIVLPKLSSEIPIARLQFGQRMICRQAGALGYSARHAGHAEASGPSMRSPANPHVGQPASSATVPRSSPDDTHPRTRSSSSAPHPGHGPVETPRSSPHDGQTEWTLIAWIVAQVSDETQVGRCHRVMTLRVGLVRPSTHVPRPRTSAESQFTSS
jgi:hypothetical protein